MTEKKRRNETRTIKLTSDQPEARIELPKKVALNLTYVPPKSEATEGAELGHEHGTEPPLPLPADPLPVPIEAAQGYGRARGDTESHTKTDRECLRGVLVKVGRARLEEFCSDCHIPWREFRQRQSEFILDLIDHLEARRKLPLLRDWMQRHEPELACELPPL